MPSSPSKIVLCRYHYDPLDRQNGCSVHQQPAIQRFNCKDRLATEIQGAARWSFFQHDEQLLAQLNQLYARVTSTLLATDQQRSVLNALDANQPNPLAYTPYGHRPALNGLLSLLGFNGERPDPVTGHYHLGNGYRQFNPVLMRFNSPDSWSPFGRGGVNAYAYCGADPMNGMDPTGHFKISNLIEMLKKAAKNHHSGPKKISKFTEPAIRDTAGILGGKNKIIELAKEAKMEPEAFLLRKTVEARLAETTKILETKPNSPQRSIEKLEAIQKNLKETNDVFFDLLVGTREDGLRPTDMNKIQKNHQMMLGGINSDLKQARANIRQP
ncbi:RHS repeat-associated core domain-containing protein [Pseudomonas sp. C32]|uniref:RHS repeat-associated core domain-containing protein n=1 Tax=Pseudomonas sp. C32 TaxID=1529208 RepID=UPI00262BD728|nr:RHS repeat-associated core domain-containing protein [Pseudomonas sp. C32]MDN4546489.1 RHS repeat-associated core domain-containing protein [Pseudomonas sp. C32]